MSELLVKEMEKCVAIGIDVGYNWENKSDMIQMTFIDEDGAYSEVAMLVETQPHIGDFGKKYIWKKKTT